MITWDIFVACIKSMQKISNDLNDGWVIKEKSDRNCGIYITKKCTYFNKNNKIINFEYHIAYHQNYCVPILCFKCWKTDGTLITAEEFWEMSNFSKEDNVYKVLTQMEHPVLQLPFLTLHPCKTEEIMINFEKSKNPVVSWLASMSYYVLLNLPDDYIRSCL